MSSAAQSLPQPLPQAGGGDRRLHRARLSRPPLPPPLRLRRGLDQRRRARLSARSRLAARARGMAGGRRGRAGAPPAPASSPPRRSTAAAVSSLFGDRIESGRQLAFDPATGTRPRPRAAGGSARSPSPKAATKRPMPARDRGGLGRRRPRARPRPAAVERGRRVAAPARRPLRASHDPSLPDLSDDGLARATRRLAAAAARRPAAARRGRARRARRRRSTACSAGRGARPSTASRPPIFDDAGRQQPRDRL